MSTIDRRMAAAALDCTSASRSSLRISLASSRRVVRQSRVAWCLKRLDAAYVQSSPM